MSIAIGSFTRDEFEEAVLYGNLHDFDLHAEILGLSVVQLARVMHNGELEKLLLEEFQFVKTYELRKALERAGFEEIDIVD